jgi:hypothetical protein
MTPLVVFSIISHSKSENKLKNQQKLRIGGSRLLPNMSMPRPSYTGLKKPPCDEERNRHKKQNPTTFSPFKHQILLRLESRKKKKKKNKEK